MIIDETAECNESMLSICTISCFSLFVSAAARVVPAAGIGAVGVGVSKLLPSLNPI